MGGDGEITARDIRAIAQLDDPVLRNLWITMAYHDIAVRLDAVLAPDSTWPAFGVWASKTAGQSIRGDELPGVVAELLENDPHYATALRKARRRSGWMQRLGLVRSVEHSHALDCVGDASVRVAEAIARGNLLVFEELAPVFVAFCDAIDDVGPSDAGALMAAVDAALATTEPGGDPAAIAEVRLAFACYADAITSTDPARRAHLVFAANLIAVAHEQTRLQPLIVDAVDGAFDVSVEVAATQLTPRPLRWLGNRLGFHPLIALGKMMHGPWEHTVTHFMMRFDLPGERMRLDREITVVIESSVPDPLDDPRALEQWGRWGGAHAAADDWKVLRTRMRYIAHLFRQRQRDRALVASPYTSDQLVVMARGEIPDPPL